MLYYYDRVLEQNVFAYIPVTYNVTSVRDPEFLAFSEQFLDYEKRKIAKLGPTKAKVVTDVNAVESGEDEEECEEDEKGKTPRPSTRSEKRVQKDRPAWRSGGNERNLSPKKGRSKGGSADGPGSPKKGREEEERSAPGRFAERSLAEKDSLHNIWILKPGSGTNRGIGVKVFDSLETCKYHMEKWGNRKCPMFNWIIQKYMERPLLIHNRKFDIRAYAVVTQNVELYFYEEGYLRTSCQEFTMDNCEDRNIHLTNWAVQKKAENYGDFEDANQMDFNQFQEHLDEFYAEDKVDFRKQILPQMTELVKSSFLSAEKSLNINNRKHCFELFGYDFMIDQDYAVWLIEVNNNPCLMTPGETTAELLPQLIEDTFKIAVDPLFPETGDPMWKRNPKVAETKFVKLAQGTFTEPMLNRQLKKVAVRPKEDKEKPRNVSVQGPTPVHAEEEEEEEEEEEDEDERGLKTSTKPQTGLGDDEAVGVDEAYHEDGYATGVITIADSPVKPHIRDEASKSSEHACAKRHSIVEEATASPVSVVSQPVAADDASAVVWKHQNSPAKRISGRNAPLGSRATVVREIMPVSLVNALAVSPGRPGSPGCGDKVAEAISPPSLSTMLRQSQHSMNQALHIVNPLAEREGGNLPKVGDRFKGGKLSTGRYDSKRGDARNGAAVRSPGSQSAGGVPELPDIRDIAGKAPHREPPKVVKEAAMEAEDVARQLRDAGLIAEAAALERLRCELMAPGADLAAKKNEARMLAEKLRAQAKEKAHSRRFARQQAALSISKGGGIKADHRNLPSVLGMSMVHI